MEKVLISTRHIIDVQYVMVGRRQWQPTPVLLPGKSHGWGSQVGCSPWGREESDTTEQLHFHFSLSCIGEGNGNPLQCSCLENPRDGGARWAAIYGVAQSRTRLKWLSSSMWHWKFWSCFSIRFYLLVSDQWQISTYNYMQHTHQHACSVTSVLSNSLWPYVLCLRPWDSSDKNNQSGLPCPPPGDLANPRIKPGSPALQETSFPLSHQGSPYI